MELYQSFGHAVCTLVTMSPKLYIHVPVVQYGALKLLKKVWRAIYVKNRQFITQIFPNRNVSIFLHLFHSGGKGPGLI